jgi:hypothetical protein
VIDKMKRIEKLEAALKDLQQEFNDEDYGGELPAIWFEDMRDLVQRALEGNPK